MSELKGLHISPASVSGIAGLQVSAHNGYAWVRWLRRRVRSSEIFNLLAILVGMGAGLITILLGVAASKCISAR